MSESFSPAELQRFTLRLQTRLVFVAVGLNGYAVLHPLFF